MGDANEKISLREIYLANLNFDSHMCVLLLFQVVPTCESGGDDDDGSEVDALDLHLPTLVPTDHTWSCLESQALGSSLESFLKTHL